MSLLEHAQNRERLYIRVKRYMPRVLHFSAFIEVCKTKPEDPVDYLVGITFCSYGINEHFHHHILCFLVLAG